MATIAHIETITAPFLAFGANIQDVFFTQDPAGNSVTVVAGTFTTARFLELDTDSSASQISSGYLGSTAADFSDLDYGYRSLDISDWWLDAQLEATRDGLVPVSGTASATAACAPGPGHARMVIMGKTNPAVLPVPVRATPRTSCHSRARRECADLDWRGGVVTRFLNGFLNLRAQVQTREFSH